jgi:hypothetical protein
MNASERHAEARRWIPCAEEDLAAAEVLTYRDGESPTASGKWTPGQFAPPGGAGATATRGFEERSIETAG